MRHSLVFAIALLGCAEPKPPPGWGQKPVVVRPVAAPVVKKRLVIGRSGTPIGHLTTTTSSDGAIAAVYHVLQNGRLRDRSTTRSSRP